MIIDTIVSVFLPPVSLRGDLPVFFKRHRQIFRLYYFLTANFVYLISLVL